MIVHVVIEIAREQREYEPAPQFTQVGGAVIWNVAGEAQLLFVDSLHHPPGE